MRFKTSLMAVAFVNSADSLLTIQGLSYLQRRTHASVSTRSYTTVLQRRHLLSHPEDDADNLSQKSADDFFADTKSSCEPSVFEQILSSYLGPRVLLALAACVYGTNFPLGAVMDAALPASAVTANRFFIASLALSPFLFRLDLTLIRSSLIAGLFVSFGYIAQSIALNDVSPATVSFLGATVVIICPVLEFLIDGTPIQRNTWIAATFCLLGVGALELWDSPGSMITHGSGDILALVQALGFGVGIYLSSKMIASKPDQALPVTAAQISTTAFMSMLWCLHDGWIGQPGSEFYALPHLFLESSYSQVAQALVWTGLISTAANFYLEVVAVGRVPAAEASVLLASEPLWAALFAAGMLGEEFGSNDYVGGLLIVVACLINSASPSISENTSDQEA